LRWRRNNRTLVLVEEPQYASLAGVLDEPWYVIVGLVAAAVVMQAVEKRLKAIGKWPYKGENYAVNNLIWTAVLLPIGLAVGLVAYWLG
jgi:hypothetical protein